MPDREDQDSAFEDRLVVRGRPENGEAVEADRQDQHADECADDVKLPFAQCCRTQEDGGKGIEEIAVPDAERSAAEKRGQQRAR